MPTRSDIKPLVVGKIASITHRDASGIKEVDKLFETLGMGPTVRKAMALPYTRLSTGFSGGLVVSMQDAGNLKTVKDSIDLVTARAQGVS